MRCALSRTDEDGNCVTLLINDLPYILHLAVLIPFFLPVICQTGTLLLRGASGGYVSELLWGQGSNPHGGWFV